MDLLRSVRGRVARSVASILPRRLSEPFVQLCREYVEKAIIRVFYLSVRRCRCWGLPNLAEVLEEVLAPEHARQGFSKDPIGRASGLNLEYDGAMSLDGEGAEANETAPSANVIFVQSTFLTPNNASRTPNKLKTYACRLIGCLRQLRSS